MPIEFHHAPPVAALASLAQHAGAVEAHRKRRAELESMNMQLLQMRKQEQQQNLNRVFNAWQTQYGEVSALQRMKADQRFRDAQQEKAAAQQMKGWNIQQEGMDRRQEADNVAAMKRQQDEIRARGDAASIKAADAMNHDIITAVGGRLNGNGRGQIMGMMQQIAKIRGSQKIRPEDKQGKIDEIMQQITSLADDPANTVTLPGEPGYRKDYDGYYTEIGQDGQTYYKPINDDKEGFAPYLRKMRELHGHGETHDLNGDGIPDKVTHVEFETDEFGTPRYKSSTLVDIDPGKESQTWQEKEADYKKWLDQYLIREEVDTFNVDSEGNQIPGKSIQYRFHPSAPKELHVEPALGEEGGDRLAKLARAYYEKMMQSGASSGGVPGAPQAPGAGDNRADPDLKEQLQRQSQEHPNFAPWQPDALERLHTAQFGVPPSDDFRRPDFTTRDAEAAEGLMGPLDNRSIPSEQAAKAREGQRQQTPQLRHRALMMGDRELADLYGELDRINQDPSISSQAKRDEKVRLMMQIKARQEAARKRPEVEDELRNSGMFGGGAGEGDIVGRLRRRTSRAQRSDVRKDLTDLKQIVRERGLEETSTGREILALTAGQVAVMTNDDYKVWVNEVNGLVHGTKKKGAPVNRGAAPASIADAVRPFSLNKGKRRGKRFGQGGGADLTKSIAALRPQVESLIADGKLDPRYGKTLLAQLNVKTLASYTEESFTDWVETLERKLGIGSKKKVAPVNRGGK